MVYTVGLSVEQMQSLEIWRNVMIAAVPPQLADALPDLQTLRSTIKCVCGVMPANRVRGTSNNRKRESKRQQLERE